MRWKLLMCLPMLAAAAELMADDGAILRCRAIASADARLACYDGIAVGSAQSDAATSAARPADPRSSFGLSQRQDASNPQELRSRIPGRFQGWQGRSRLRLENGQVWEILDSRPGVYVLDSPAVVIRPGALGSFVMDIEGVAQRLRVRRVE